MLPPAHRLRTGEDFQRTVRGGRKARARTLVAHLDRRDPGSREGAQADGAQVMAPRVGLVVSRAVGNAVVRNRVKRRLRHVAAARLDQLPRGSVLVIRALPAAAEAPSADLARDLDRALVRALAGSRP